MTTIKILYMLAYKIYKNLHSSIYLQIGFMKTVTLSKKIFNSLVCCQITFYEDLLLFYVLTDDNF